MSAQQTLNEGRLHEALSKLQGQVRKDPSKAEYRTFLFQLLAVLGQWDRATNQLEVVGELDAGTLAMVKTYQTAIQCEVFRQQVFKGEHSPLIFGKPPKWMALQLEALRLTGNAQYKQSQSVRNQAFDNAPVTGGYINGQPFEWLADADPRIGPVLEAIINGQYYWIPLEHIRSVQIDEPSDLRDIVWMPAHFRWSNGGEIVGLIPTRYPGSELSDDPQIQMARKTEWLDMGDELFIGMGQRMLTTDEKDHSLMDIREITLNTEDESEQDINES
ncbi:hypothetical protein L3Q72_06020 [Vibrio sp. JC009]|uniref:type VI secretion system accessory protein TagJ n=1 Tax=Vibrio sp. JC009 TaxID=2912314 RepID=UPI0023AF3149|nr:type VI secretion system accessory protein TagJ [Vibrio sp. JC009]WED22948.1 hypothetical protein L3Q72_06020 [Vibrio sp. JC009]